MMTDKEIDTNEESVKVETSLETQEVDSNPLLWGPSQKKPVKDAGVRHSERLKLILAAKNPLLEAASPLLYFLAQPLRPETLANIEKLREVLVKEIQAFLYICPSANIKREHMITAQYCLCTAIDEKVNTATWGGGSQEVGPWSQASLLTIFHKENYGGDKFFLLVGRLAAQPQLHIDVLELMYEILSLGFEGRYKRDVQGAKQIEAVRNRLYTLINSEKGQVAKDLSSNWRGVTKEQLPSRRTIPVWFVAGSVTLLLVTQYIWYKYGLLEKTYRLEENILTIGKINLPKIEKKLPETLKLEVLLQPEIQKQILVVEETAEKAVVIFKGDNVFKPGRAEVEKPMQLVLQRIANELLKVKGQVIVEGHSDSSPLRGGRYADNQALSLARAQAVADVLNANQIAKERLQVVGYGDSQTITDNATPDARAKNRRVVITVQFK